MSFWTKATVAAKKVVNVPIKIIKGLTSSAKKKIRETHH